MPPSVTTNVPYRDSYPAFLPNRTRHKPACRGGGTGRPAPTRSQSDRRVDGVFSWQMLLVLIGGYLLALRKWLAGGIVAAVGLCLLLIDQLDWHIPLDKIAVPTILIAVGLSVVFSRRKYE